VLSALRNICDFVGYTPDDREVVILPLSHNFGLGHVYCNLMSGGAVYLEAGLARVGRVLKAVRDFGATGFPGTPMGFGLLIDRYGPVLAERAKNLRFIVINSAPMPPKRTEQLQALLPNTDLMVYYGLTEASRSTFVSLSQLGPDLYRTVGKPMPGLDIRLVGPDEGPVEGEGEVLIRGPSVTSGYWGQTAETEQAFRSGWFRTGDLGRFDDEGRLFITGRLKDIINVGGLKVSPREVENVLRQRDDVEDVGVVGLDGIRGLSGETVVAAVVMKSDCPFDTEACRAVCAEQLEHFKVPALFLEVGAIPRSETGKLKRQELDSLLRALLAEQEPEARC
jgi:long-chain acyl-CoA synthetase